jgi:DNA-binding IclR family transcriptional regulator
VLELIASRPGITVPEISRELDVDPPSLYRVTRKLLAEGTVSKEGKGLRLA